jgi:hypothetical protein
MSTPTAGFTGGIGNAEEWRPAPSMPVGYFVSSLGRIRGPRTVLKPILDVDGYLRVLIRVDGRTKGFKVHRQVALAFLGPCPAGCDAAHKDHDRTNAHLDNLEYLTHADNVKATAAAGRSMRGEGHVRARLTEEQARAILAEFDPAKHKTKSFAKARGYTHSIVWHLIKGKTWKHLPRMAP